MKKLNVNLYLSMLALAQIFVTTQHTHAQDLKLKGDKILDGKEVLFELEGHASAIKGVDILFKAPVEGESFHLVQTSMRPENPLIPSKYWHVVTFQSSGEKLRYVLDKPYYSKKKILEILQENSDFRLFDLSVPPSERKTLALAKDQSETILKDSTEIANSQHNLKMALAKEKKERNVNIRVNLVPMEYEPPALYPGYKGPVIERKYWIKQGEKIIGKVEVERRETGMTHKPMTYAFFKKLEEPIDFMGESVHYAVCASFRVDDANSKDNTLLNTYIYTYADDARHGFNEPNKAKIADYSRAEHPIVQYLAQEGYL